MRARKIDANLTDIVKAARRLGLLVFVRNDELGDLDVQYPPRLGGRNEIWEVKARKGKFTQGQKDYRAEGWRIRTVRSVEDVLTDRHPLLTLSPRLEPIGQKPKKGRKKEKN